VGAEQKPPHFQQQDRVFSRAGGSQDVVAAKAVEPFDEAEGEATG